MHMRREGDPRQKGSVSASHDSAPIPIQPSRWLSRRVSEESIQTELCEGPIPDSPPRPATPEQPVAHAVSDRAELIKRLKRGESPTWIPNRHLESLLSQSTASSPPGTPQPPHSASPGLLPSAAITPEKLNESPGDQVIDSPLREGLRIERPPSALHSGNFTPDELSPDASAARDATHPSHENRFRSASDLWMSTSPPADFEPFSFRRDAANYRRDAFKSPGPSSLSSSLSSSFVYKPPTSPLVQSESNEDPDLTLPLASFNIEASSPRNPRRHTLNFSHSPFTDTATGPRQASLRREGTLPYQAHQPRRSLNSTPGFLFAGTSPQTPPVFHSRRPSFTSEASPLQHASMVGSYEESILRGRMSTTPSKPLEFTAQIGVLGLGKCKPNLRCPAHVTLPFSAVFYSYASTSYGRSKMEDGPSPYVGQIDLENGLPNPDEAQQAKRKLHSRYQDRKGAPEEGLAHESAGELSEGDGASKSTKSKRRSRSPKAPPGGCYRIPERGQLQIIIKNQNKTAVKLFLVPYDLAGMEPGTKTFIRQRSYSAGPVIEPDIPNVKDPGGAADRPTLRYLVHLHICCPSRGRYYLYKSIRLVFANRVPDDKERLRNEVTYPDPRFTPYKPMRAMHPTLGIGHGGGASPGGASLAAAQVFRRRSVGFSLAHHHPFHPAEAHTTTPQNQRQSQTISSTFLPSRAHHPQTTDSSGNLIYSNNNITTTITATNATTTTPTPELQMTDRPPFSASPSPSPSVPPPSPSPFSASITLAPTSPANAATDVSYAYSKLSRGDVGYGGGSGGSGGGGSGGGRGANNPFGAGAEGLLSKRLRSLGVKAPPDGP